MYSIVLTCHGEANLRPDPSNYLQSATAAVLCRPNIELRALCISTNSTTIITRSGYPSRLTTTRIKQTRIVEHAYAGLSLII